MSEENTELVEVSADWAAFFRGGDPIHETPILVALANHKRNLQVRIDDLGEITLGKLGEILACTVRSVALAVSEDHQTLDAEAMEKVLLEEMTLALAKVGLPKHQNTKLPMSNTVDE